MLGKLRRNIGAGILTFIPIWVTAWVISVLVGILVSLGSPFVNVMFGWVRNLSPGLASAFSAPWFQSAIAIATVLAALYLLGEIATAVAGRRLLAAFDYLISHIPIV
ncbi:MAG: hypothetical protein Q7S58_19575 [Candidatus Binatus sp.]|uniref:hypothetical protein n=1 Tax=Candidatus Binatus sp. TaxID=2811406 RepID=UPI00271D86DB|nr:hypothetical protein [Candidatus Binatus sp.]MDO8434602.1 hypothetical protein [Candidatus Binatus sp.]